MANDLLGRTNQAFPKVWLSLATPTTSLSDNWVAELVQSAQEAQTVIDISANAALWGGQMRGTDSLLAVKGGLDIERAPDEKGACDLVQAHLIETLSAIGREWIDFYFLKVRRGLEEYQINGALQALSSAKDEGHVRHLSIACEGHPLAVLGVWQFHDAFEAALLREEDASDDGLVSFAKERRVGIVVAAPQVSPVGQCTLVTVSRPEEIVRAQARVGAAR